MKLMGESEVSAILKTAALAAYNNRLAEFTVDIKKDKRGPVAYQYWVDGCIKVVNNPPGNAVAVPEVVQDTTSKIVKEHDESLGTLDVLEW